MQPIASGSEPVKSYRDLRAWQRAMDVATEAYRLAALLPDDERYRITSQLIRAAVSVPSNIAEGRMRGSRRDYANFVGIARGSLAEVETILLLSVRVGLLASAETARAHSMAAETGRMLNVLWDRLRNSPAASDS